MCVDYDNDKVYHCATVIKHLRRSSNGTGSFFMDCDTGSAAPNAPFCDADTSLPLPGLD